MFISPLLPKKKKNPTKKEMRNSLKLLALLLFLLRYSAVTASTLTFNVLDYGAVGNGVADDTNVTQFIFQLIFSFMGERKKCDKFIYLGIEFV